MMTCAGLKFWVAPNNVFGIDCCRAGAIPAPNVLDLVPYGAVTQLRTKEQDYVRIEAIKKPTIGAGYARYPTKRPSEARAIGAFAWKKPWIDRTGFG
jgi:hypothetical protein